jgi:hypothetical protein
MITPKWLNTRCQPIAITDVLQFLSKALILQLTIKVLILEDILTYKEMLFGFAKAKNLKRWIFTVPVTQNFLLNFTLLLRPLKLASALVSSMKVEVVCKDTRINELLGLLHVI